MKKKIQSPTILAKFAHTQVLSVAKNTAYHFEGVLKDNLGTFKAVLFRHPNNTVDVLFDGAPHRMGLSIEFAQWEFSSIWRDLETQGHKVLAMA